MTDYAITVAPDEVTKEYEVTLRGPGIAPEGQHYVFRNLERCEIFEEAVNFAYRQGLRDGACQALSSNERLWVVSGTTPDNVSVRRESFWERLTRRTFRERFR
jgi:hypothetical protein